jgi:glycosyltransferase involved in cell wall biosynthesis
MPRHAVRYRVMSAGISRFICVSAHASAHLITYAGIPPDKVEVVHNGVDRSRFIRARLPSERLAVRKALGFSKEDVIIGNVSRLVENKGHDVFLKAALMVLTRRSDARFLIVGDGPQRAGLELLARQLGIAGQVLFAGARHDIADLLSVMDAFAFPAHHEGFGLSLVEAMASGVPVVASNDSAIPEIIRDEQEGILFSPGDERALAQALLRLVNDRALPGRLAAAALKRSEQFSCQTTARKLENIYDEVLRR